jgi:hypothetical protein
MDRLIGHVENNLTLQLSTVLSRLPCLLISEESTRVARTGIYEDRPSRMP